MKYKIKIKEDFKDLEDIHKYQRYLAHSNPKLVQKAKENSKALSDNLTLPEKYIKQLLYEIGLEYEFQKIVYFPSGDFCILDFYIPTLHLIIELDGLQHYNVIGEIKDLHRNQKLCKVGFDREVRIPNSKAILLNTESINNVLVPFYDKP